MVFDIKKLKSIGYNMLRKHVKIESPLYYAAADELGILVMQDMPCLRESPTKAQQKEFERQLDLMIDQFSSYSSIFSWVRLFQREKPCFCLHHIRSSTTKAGAS